jgi:2-polyprenyl-6-methoxyphenol hydroxylase-like FAD-dependent oxidoreductase
VSQLFARSKPQVLIVGAGPTGLTLANALAVYGVPFEIVDAKEAPSRDSKALVLNVASLAGLELLGVRVGERGKPLRRANIFWQGRRLSAVDVSRVDYPNAHMIAQPQHQTEEDLLRALERTTASKSPVAWGSRLTGLTQAGDHVSVEGVDAQGAPWRREYSFVVGCDGKRSVVREALGIDLVGHDYAMHFVLGDFHLSWGAKDDAAYYHVDEDTFFIAVPLGEGQWRLVLKREGAPAELEQSHELLRRAAQRFLGADVRMGEPLWLSQAPFYERTATALGSGRVLIAGDAAHLFSPIGGTGMNTGIQDALNLGWKLARVLRGQGDAARLLQSYLDERLEAAKGNAMATDRSTRLIARIDRDEASVLPFVPALRRRRILGRVLPMQVSGLTLRYASQALVAGLSRGAGCFSLGFNELRARTQEAGMQPNAAAVWVVVSTSADVSHDLVDRVASRLQKFAELVHLVAVSGEGDVPSAADAVPRVVVSRRCVRRLQTSAGVTLLAVRPDGVVGFAGEESELDQLSAYLEALCRPAAPFDRPAQNSAVQDGVLHLQGRSSKSSNETLQTRGTQ